MTMCEQLLYSDSSQTGNKFCERNSNSLISAVRTSKYSHVQCHNTKFDLLQLTIITEDGGELSLTGHVT
jgi:hypothetical protein